MKCLKTNKMVGGIMSLMITNKIYMTKQSFDIKIQIYTKTRLCQKSRDLITLKIIGIQNENIQKDFVYTYQNDS